MNWLARLERPATAWALAGLTVLVTVALVPLSLAARQNPLARSFWSCSTSRSLSSG